MLISQSIVRQYNVFPGILSSEASGPIEAIFYLEPSWVGETKVCSDGHGQLTKIVAMPICPLSRLLIGH